MRGTNSKRQLTGRLLLPKQTQNQYLIMFVFTAKRLVRLQFTEAKKQAGNCIVPKSR